MASPSHHNRTTKSLEDDDEDELDKVELMLKRAGCLELHYKVQECMAEHNDWRKCQQALKDFKECFNVARKEDTQ